LFLPIDPEKRVFLLGVCFSWGHCRVRSIENRIFPVFSLLAGN
jgi:hypothetical protein